MSTHGAIAHRRSDTVRLEQEHFAAGRGSRTLTVRHRWILSRNAALLTISDGDKNHGLARSWVLTVVEFLGVRGLKFGPNSPKPSANDDRRARRFRVRRRHRLQSITLQCNVLDIRA